MRRYAKREFVLIISLFIISSTIPFNYNLFFINNEIKKTTSEIPINLLLSSDSGREDLIIFFNTSTYNQLVKQNFESFGGIVKEHEDWNNTFNEFSGFAGKMPLENISEFQENFPEINIEHDELIETQMNYVSVQTHAANKTWAINGYKGNTGSSVAVLDTGINPNHEYIQSNVVGWENFINSDPISDDNGHGTFVSSIIAGTGNLSYDSEFPSLINLQNNFTHLELFEEFLPSKNYSIKLISFNTSKLDSYIVVNSSCQFNLNEIDSIWFEVYHNSILVNSSRHQNPNENWITYQRVSQWGLGIYDIYIKYHKKSNTNPSISYNVDLSFFPETYTQNYNQFNGIANATKILSYKVANQSGYGYISDLISGLASVIQNRTTYQILCVCLSIATFGTDVKAINRVIDEVINNNIFVVIAAGNLGVSGDNALNNLASNKRAIVVGAINDKDQITSYSSMGKEVSSGTIKPDLVTPGGSLLKSYRTVISAAKASNFATSSYGTSISAAIVAATLNILVEAKWGNWGSWNSDNLDYWVNYLKAVLCMTASETNLNRENDPTTEINEANYSPYNFNGLSGSLKDEHEGYGRVNIESAIDALTKSLLVNESLAGYLESSDQNPLGTHVVARKLNLEKNTQYLFNLTELEDNVNFEFYLFSNYTTQEGEPILLQSSRKWYEDTNYFYFTPKANETNCVLTIKAIEGNSNFTFIISPVRNDFIPELKIGEIQYIGGSKNDTIISLQEFYGNEPLKNYSIDNYWFYINYFDNDTSNVPPQDVYVHIVETLENYSLFKLNPFDNNFTDGATFRSQQIKFPSAGLYYYYFIASDGNNIVRFPNTGNLSVLIEFPTDSEQFPYSHYFNNGLDGWTFNGTGWGVLNQSNSNDNRTNIYNSPWSSIYFGRDHFFPQNYTYQPYIITDPYPNGTLRSPLFNLTQINENTTQPFAIFGLRVSINAGDIVFLQINLNWTGWITLRTYTNIERDWFTEKLNISEYIGNFVQFRFLVSLDSNFDPVNYKGLILDYFSLDNYTNQYSPELEPNIHQSRYYFDGFKFNKFTFICNYYDQDNNYPDYIYIEIAGNNISMINIYGSWNASYTVADSKGIYFIRSLVLNDFSNLTFRFHTFDGKYLYTTDWFNQNNSLIVFKNPDPWEFDLTQDGKEIGYEFIEDISSGFYIAGTPIQKEVTSWLLGDNSWHPISILGKKYFYAGYGQSFGSLDQGYGNNWQISLITHPIRLRDEYSLFLNFYHEIDLQNEFFTEENLDKCSIFISKDYGSHWVLIEEFYFDSDNLLGNQSFDVSLYSNEVVMFKFTLLTNENIVGLGGGWIISDIYVGYNKNSDFIAPTVKILNPLSNSRINSNILVQANISDNRVLDINRLYIYIDNKIVDKGLINFDPNTGLLSFQWDTTYLLDGKHEIIVRVYDLEGNIGEELLNVYIENGIFNMRMWGPWIILIIVAIVVSVIIYLISEKKGKLWISKKREINAESIRFKSIDKDQVLKRIELFESEEQTKRPLILYCKFCKSWFESNRFNYICPICEHDQIYAAYNCINCNKWYFKDEPGDNYFCTNKKCKGIKLIKRELDEVKDILGGKDIFLRKYYQKKSKFSILD